MLRTRASSNKTLPPARKGIVLLGVLVVVVLLSLSVYHYSDLAFAEFKSADQSQRQAQALALANSGVHYAASLLSNADAMNNTVGNNPYSNPQLFSHIVVKGDSSGYGGTFSLLAPPDANDASGGIRFGVTDEGGKINVNAFMNIDPTGQTLLNVLQQLPSATEQIAGAIVDWLDADDTPQSTGGAESDYYSTLNPPYYARNGNIDSVEELLLVQGVTPDLLYGQYRNPYFGLPLPGGSSTPASGGGNTGGSMNNNPSSSNNSNNSNAGGNNNNSSGNTNSSGSTVSSSIDLGWSGFLTCYSREQNVDLNGNPLIYLNDTDLNNLQTNLTNLGIDPTIINFIILYRQNGGSSSGSGTGSGSGGSGVGGGSGAGAGSGKASSTGSSSSSKSVQGNLSQVTLDLTQAGSNQINSLFDLINATVQVTSNTTTMRMTFNTNGMAMTGTITMSGGNSSGGSSNTTVYASPFADQGMLQQYFPMLYLGTTLQQGTDIPARVNINTAPPEVLQALTAVSNKGFNSTDVQNILSTRPTFTAGQPLDQAYATPLWLVTQAGLSPSKVSTMDKYITTRSQVYRVHSLGMLDAQGLAARVEAVIDTNGGQPRILSWRNLTQLGKGVTSTQLQQAGGQK
jgi:type II secretory pathway component PulK